MVSDLNINAFGLNFRVEGKINDDVEEANLLGNSVYRALSVIDEPVEVNTRPTFISSTTFEMDSYGECATKFKKRTGLETGSCQDLFVMRNVVSPISYTTNFCTGS